jgi:hypothetical protein
MTIVSAAQSIMGEFTFVSDKSKDCHLGDTVYYDPPATRPDGTPKWGNGLFEVHLYVENIRNDLICLLKFKAASDGWRSKNANDALSITVKLFDDQSRELFTASRSAYLGCETRYQELSFSDGGRNKGHLLSQISRGLIHANDQNVEDC